MAPRSVVFRLTHARSFSISHVALGLFDGVFELRREFQFVFNDIVQPFANLPKFFLRQFAEFGFHLLDFTHAGTME
jgi:hypothetical protein